MAKEPEKPFSVTSPSEAAQEPLHHSEYGRKPVPVRQSIIGAIREITERDSVPPVTPQPPNDTKRGERPGAKTLDYIALGLLLAPPAVVVDMYLKSDTIDWWKTGIATAVCWVAGGLVVLASHRWQSWRSENKRILPYLRAAENRFWGKALIVAAAIGGALALSSVLSNRSPVAPPPMIGFSEQQVNEKIAAATKTLQQQLDAARKQIAALTAPARGQPPRPPAPNEALSKDDIATKIDIWQSVLGQMNDFTRALNLGYQLLDNWSTKVKTDRGAFYLGMIAFRNAFGTCQERLGQLRATYPIYKDIQNDIDTSTPDSLTRPINNFLEAINALTTPVPDDYEHTLRPYAGSLKRQLDIVRDWDTATQRLAHERDKELSGMVPTK